jgi:hypothetical protein
VNRVPKLLLGEFRETLGDLRVLKRQEVEPIARDLPQAPNGAPTKTAIAVEDQKRLGRRLSNVDRMWHGLFYLSSHLESSCSRHESTICFLVVATLLSLSKSTLFIAVRLKGAIPDF